MGSYCEIARRLNSQQVQHGCGGCDGYFKYVGRMLLNKYNSLDMVEYLFSLGQLSVLRLPLGKDSPYQTEVCNYPHWIDNTERLIFGRTAFPCCGYLYDSDNTWYYVLSGPFRVKIPLALVAANQDRDGEFTFISKVEYQVLAKIFNEQWAECLGHSGINKEELGEIYRDIIHKGVGNPLYLVWEKYRSIYECFDDWVLVRADESGRNVKEIVLRLNEEPHTETIFW